MTNPQTLNRAGRLLPQPAFPGQLAIRRTDPVCCSICGRIVARKARQQRFCSDRCRERNKGGERSKIRSRKALLGGDTGAPPAALKKTNSFNVLPAPKIGSSIALQAPHRVIKTEVFGDRFWRQAVSSGGIVCEVSTWRKRTLVEGGAS